MKLRRTLFCLAVLLSSIFASCSTKEDFMTIPINAPTKSGASTYGGCQLISKEKVPKILKSYLAPTLFKNIEKYSLTVISEDGYNLIYVVNFDEGGWVLISGVSVPGQVPILGFSTDSSFNPESSNSGASFWLDATKRRILEIIVQNGL